MSWAAEGAIATAPQPFVGQSREYYQEVSADELAHRRDDPYHVPARWSGCSRWPPLRRTPSRRSRWCSPAPPDAPSR
ncbi:hypothetical protein LP419_10460 [Massilia sp. H-1]|nr:hypothetical protein LP419_10460 [Massilia sp. H-1]